MFLEAANTVYALQLLGIIWLLSNLLLFVLDYHVQILPDSINCNLSAFLFYFPMIFFYGFHIFSIQHRLELSFKTSHIRFKPKAVYILRSLVFLFCKRIATDDHYSDSGAVPIDYAVENEHWSFR